MDGDATVGDEVTTTVVEEENFAEDGEANSTEGGRPLPQRRLIRI